MTDVAPAIEVRGLTKDFGSFRAVDQLDFTVHHGTVTGFLGANGAGKTTTLRMLLGLERPSDGSSLVLGAPYTKLRHPYRRVGAIFEASSFHPGRSARTHLKVLCSANGIAMARVDEVLTMVGLGEFASRRVGGFSLGMRQRLSLASALLGDPEVLILDEPANGLDPEGIRWLRDLLRHLAGLGKAVLVSSHLLAEVQQTVDHVVIIRKGKLVRQGSLREVIGAHTQTTWVRTPNVDALRTALAAASIAATDGDDGRLRVNAPSAAVGELAAHNHIVLHELTPAEVSLEDAFFELTDEEAS